MAAEEMVYGIGELGLKVSDRELTVQLISSTTGLASVNIGTFLKGRPPLPCSN